MKVEIELVIWLTKKKTPSRSCRSERGSSFLVLTAREPSVKPLADVVRCYIRCDGQNESRNIRHLSHLPSRINGRARPQNHYTTRFAKKIQETMPRAKASPFGRGVTEGDGEGKPGRKEPLRSDGQALCQSDAIAVPELFVSGLALSVSSQAPRQLPQRGSHWHVGQLSSGRAKHNISEAAVLRCLGQRQLDKVRLSRSRCPRKQGPPFCVLSSLSRPVESEPACQGLSLWERWHCEAMTERATVNLWKMHE